MKTFKVYYGKGTPDEIDYGEYKANSAFDAIEQIVELDAIRNSYNTNEELHVRHQDMYAAEKINSPSIETMQSETIDKIQETNENVKIMEKTFDELEKLYEFNLDELAQFKTASSFGATYKYNSGKTKFIPIFVLDDNVTIDGEEPYGYTLNFNQELLAYWITSIKQHAKGKKDLEDEE